ncbi:hypothetical protein BKA70DRAFT_1420769 [Coprinopsis sp. MPI-PUGE-AT-0042]|nr:hypothetical protein BKA70DRAFT_1420769 [Coprinopsis sp. MPI-PUGE-AT-0042]
MSLPVSSGNAERNEQALFELKASAQTDDHHVFKTLTDQTVIVELKNDLMITGVLKSVDQFLNIRLDNIKVQDEERHPHMMAVKNCFIRGSVVRYVQLPAEHVDTQLLEDATRREAATQVKR